MDECEDRCDWLDADDALLSCGEDGMYVFGVPTSSPALILACFLLAASEQTVGEA